MSEVLYTESGMGYFIVVLRKAARMKDSVKNEQN